MNKNCNYLQSILGIFVHSVNIPQRVIEVLAQAGLSISIKSIQRAVKSMSVDSAQRIKEGLRSLKVGIAYDMSAFVLLIHGDLLTKEQLDTIRDSRRIEDTPKNRFQFVVFLLGLFHCKMACADALWRTYLRAKEGRADLNSAYQHVGILWPQETRIMTSKPGF
jgi:hypothetical protein